MSLEKLTPQHPFNWSPSRKYAIVLAACYLTALTAANSTCMAILATWGPDWFHTSRIVFMVGAALYNIAVSTTPLILAPISEHLGRNEIYQVTSIMSVACLHSTWANIAETRFCSSRRFSLTIFRDFSLHAGL